MLGYGELFVLHELHRQGLTISAIAARTGYDRKTVRKYLKQGLEPPIYTPRPPFEGLLSRYHSYLRSRVESYPELSANRLLREIKAMGYQGSYTTLTDYLRQVRPAAYSGYERRFETPPGHQAQVDFAHFKTAFRDDPEQVRVVWLFSLVLGHSRYLFGRYVAHQDLQALIRCHIQAFAELGGVPQRILYDRMKTAVLGEQDGEIIYNDKLLDMASHYGFTPKACAPYRAKTKGKVERPFRYIRQDFFLGRTFQNLADLNQQLTQWLTSVANRRHHGTTRRWVHEAFAEEQPHLQSLPSVAYRSVLKLERRVTRDGVVSVQGNFYSVPDSTRQRVVDVELLADEVRLFEAGQLIAVHPILEGRGQRRVAPDHRQQPRRQSAELDESATVVGIAGSHVPTRSLEVYDSVAQALAVDVEVSG